MANVGQEKHPPCILSCITPWANSITDAPHSFVEGNSYVNLMLLYVHVCGRSQETGKSVIVLSVAAKQF